MKKAYIKPEIEVETIELENMIATSPGQLIIDDKGGYADETETVYGKERNNDWSGLLW